MCTVNIRGHEANFYEAEARCHEAEIGFFGIFSVGFSFFRFFFNTDVGVGFGFLKYRDIGFGFRLPTRL